MIRLLTQSTHCIQRELAANEVGTLSCIMRSVSSIRQQFKSRIIALPVKSAMEGS